jgi:hypothetical protein
MEPLRDVRDVIARVERKHEPVTVTRGALASIFRGGLVDHGSGGSPAVWV